MWTLLRPPRPRVALALQGGGAHGAFTWGVLDALLELDVPLWSAASGSSAGALNAVLLAHGLMNGGREGARQALQTFWMSVTERLAVDPVMPTGDGPGAHVAPWFRSMWWWSRMLASAGMAPGGDHPLADLLRAQVDFDGLRRHAPLQLYIGATHATSGRLHVFRERELTLQHVLASACLPQWHAAVSVDGEPFWDGGFSANPPLLPLLRDAGARDVLLVLLLSGGRQPLPTSMRDVEQRVLELGFVTPFLAELRTLAAAPAPPRWGIGPARGVRWHAIDASPALGALPVETRLVPSRRFLPLLHELGRQRTFDWWAAHGSTIGRRGSADLRSLGA